MKINSDGSIAVEQVSEEEVRQGLLNLSNAGKATPREIVAANANIAKYALEELENNKDLRDGIKLILNHINYKDYVRCNPNLHPSASQHNMDLWNDVYEFMRLVNVVNYALNYETEGVTQFMFDIMMHEAVDEGQKNPKCLSDLAPKTQEISSSEILSSCESFWGDYGN
jgi:hypothetical protein